MISNQAFFNKVKAHLLSMKRRCINRPGEGCVYFKYSGERCAIGGALPIKWAKKLEDADVGTISVVYDDNNRVSYGLGGVMKYLPENENFACALQQAHDGNKPSKWPGALRKIAKEYDLTY